MLSKRLGNGYKYPLSLPPKPSFLPTSPMTIIMWMVFGSCHIYLCLYFLVFVLVLVLLLVLLVILPVLLPVLLLVLLRGFVHVSVSWFHRCSTTFLLSTAFLSTSGKCHYSTCNVYSFCTGLCPSRVKTCHTWGTMFRLPYILLSHYIINHDMGFHHNMSYAVKSSTHVRARCPPVTDLPP